MSKQINVLLVDDCPDLRALVRLHLAMHAPEIMLTDYGPETQGLPDDGFCWQRYDLLLLDYQLGEGQDGLSWLAELRKRESFPPTVLVTGQGDEYVAVRALKLGAEDYIRKQDLSTQRLVEVVGESAQGRAPASVTQIADSSELLEPEATVVRGINGYKMMRKIGAGTQSRIYLAERLRDRKEVALKIIAINPMEEDMLRRFKREVSALERMHSSHVVWLFDYAFSDDCGYIAMEHLPRRGLRERTGDEFSADAAVEYMRQLLRGLQVIHAAWVMHRDLKPTNLLLRDDGTLVIAAFGISRPLGNDIEHTTEGMLIWIPAYMSPEQCLGTPVTEHADLYSAGVMFYEMLTGVRPFRGESVSAVLHQHVHEKIPSLPEKIARFQPMINALLAKEPNERPSSAQTALDFFRHRCIDAQANRCGVRVA